MTSEAIDTETFRSMNNGMYIITIKRGGELVGCVVKTFRQVTSKVSGNGLWQKDSPFAMRNRLI